MKVTRERVLETEPHEIMWDMNELYNSLKKIVNDSGEESLAKHLESGWHQIWLERNIQKWDEDFLKAVAGEESHDEKLSRLTHQVTQGRGSVRMGIQSNGAMTLGTTASTAATWTSHTDLEKELQELKDEIRAKRMGGK